MTPPTPWIRGWPRRLAYAAVVATVAVASYELGASRATTDFLLASAASLVGSRPAAAPSPPAAAGRAREPRQPELHAVQARAAVIARDAAAIESECQTAAAGDWNRWERDTAGYRAALRAGVDRLKTFDPPVSPFADARTEALAGNNSFPLFELAPRGYLNYLYDPAALDAFRKDRPVVAAHRWLRQQDIDLIFVPVPKMTEVYADRFLDPCPADGVIAPHVRRTLLELLHDDVEVVDGLALFRTVRDADREYLYNACDPHWAPRGMRVMARAIADRVSRYRFGMRARFGPPAVATAVGPYTLDGFPGGIGSRTGWLALSPEQQQLARAAQTTTQVRVTTPDGRPVPDDPDAPVLLIGHSYVEHFREQLIRELNLPVHTHAAPGATTQLFGDFLREPELLDNCRVVVWITTEQHMTDFPPLPEPIRAALKSDPRPAHW